MKNEIKKIVSDGIQFNILRNILSFLSISYLFYLLNMIVFDNFKHPMILVAALMLTFPLVIGLSYSIISIRNLRSQAKKKGQISDLLNKIVTNARTENNYEGMNYILSLKDAHLYILEMGYYINQHFNGEWLDLKKISYPESWGKTFFQDMSTFFIKEKCTKEDLSNPLIICTFLATVKPKIINSVLSELGEKLMYNNELFKILI